MNGFIKPLCRFTWVDVHSKGIIYWVLLWWLAVQFYIRVQMFILPMSLDESLKRNSQNNHRILQEPQEIINV